MRTLIVSLSLVASLQSYAQTQQFVGPRASRSSISVEADVVFAARGDQNLRLDLYRPRGRAIVPVVLFANGGNPAMRSWPGYVGWGEAVAGIGLAAVHYDANRPTARADLEAALRFLRENAQRYAIDPSRLVIWSSSSNVPIGLPFAMDPDHEDVRAAVVYYGDAEVDRFRLDVPVFYARAGRDVPALNARIDALVGRALAANAPWTVVNVPAGLHGFDSFDSDDVAREVVVRTLAFMKEVTTPATSRAYAVAAEEAANAAAFARGDWSAAVSGYRRRLSALPNDAEGHRRLGLALMETGQFAEALQSLEKAWELGRRGPRDTALPAAAAAAGAQDVDRAVYWLDVLLSTPHGGDPRSYLTDARFARIKDAPAFVAVIEKHVRK